MSRKCRAYYNWHRPKNNSVELDPEVDCYNKQLRETLIKCTKEELREKKKKLQQRLMYTAPEITRQIFVTIQVINVLMKLK